MSTWRESHVHDLRHSFAWAALRAGMTVAKLQRALGHRKIDTTEIYARHNVLTPEALEVADAVESSRKGVSNAA